MLRFIALCASALILTPRTVTAQANPTTPDAKIQNALSAAPAYIAREAAVWDWPITTTEPPVLRAGSNGWTCFPNEPNNAVNAPVCMDDAMLQWRLALWRGQDVPLDRIAVRYMLQGGPGVDDQGRQNLGPHIMISIPPGVALANWIGDTQEPNGPWVVSDEYGTVLFIPVAAPGTAVR